jgi:hypothetical protein
MIKTEVIPKKQQDWPSLEKTSFRNFQNRKTPSITSGGFPSYLAHASNKPGVVCAHRALIPWLTLAGGLLALARKARQHNPGLRFFSFESIQPATQYE